MANLPPNPPKLPRNLFKLLLGAIVVCFVFLAGYGLGIKQMPPDDGSYVAGYEAARQKLADSGMVYAQPMLTFLMGAVSEVGADYVGMKTIQVVANPLDEPAPLDRKVLVGTDTKIYRSEPKTGERTKIKLEEVEVTDSISIFASEDITYANSFTATEITVTTVPEAATVPTEE